MIGPDLLVVRLLKVIGAIPGHPGCRSRGFGRNGGPGLLLVILLVLMLL